VTPGRPGFGPLSERLGDGRDDRVLDRVTLAGEELDFPLAEASGGDVGAGRQLGGALSATSRTDTSAVVRRYSSSIPIPTVAYASPFAFRRWRSSSRSGVGGKS